MLGEPVLSTARHLGYPISEDLNGSQTEGFSISDITVDARGRRSSTARAFLAQARRRRNLTVIRSATASKIIIQEGKAVGLEFAHAGRLNRAHARREVILSSGTYNTPKLLLLSGIGPAEELEKHNIPVVHDLPGVGRNVADHASCFIEFSTREPITLLRELRVDRAARWFAQWALSGSGLFASQASSAQALLRTQSHLLQPDLQVFFNPMRMDGKVWIPGLGDRQEHRLNAAMVLLHPESRGSVRLRSPDPMDSPRICLNLLAEPADIQTFLRGFEIVRALYQAPPLASLIASEFAPGADVKDPASLMAYMRRSLSTVRHPVGSCRMGVGPDSVVDPQLRLRGIPGLRIADASIMPTITGGNTNAPTIMIAEKAADLILT
jgi:choline dehydrogenase